MKLAETKLKLEVLREERDPLSWLIGGGGLPVSTSGQLYKSFTADTKQGLSDQGNIEGWNPGTH